jgi:predicted nucleic-acid-binding Zn-ribbon protein
MELYWKCPNCDGIVDFTKEVSYVFEENGEAEFDVESGLWLHTICCDNCPTVWTMNISGSSVN